MPAQLTRIDARNFRSLEHVDVTLGRFNVLIGPNGSGKTNLLNVLRFLATTVRFDLSAALDEWRGFEHVQRQGRHPGPVKIAIEGVITQHASQNAPDRYELEVGRGKTGISRKEDFTFKRQGGQGRRYTARGSRITISGDAEKRMQLASPQTTGLATLPKLADDEGGLGIRTFAEFLSRIRVLEPNVDLARQPARQLDASLAGDAANLADALKRIQIRDPDSWALLVSDVGRCLPGLVDVRLQPVGGGTQSVSVQLIEEGLTTPIDLVDASFGTVRVLALLAALHEPDPPPFTAIEEVDHGLHPYALDVIVDRLRSASARTQILAATHSPTLVNRLNADEIIVCDRDPASGASVIPAITRDQVRAALAASDWRAGELWFSGALRGVPA